MAVTTKIPPGFVDMIHSIPQINAAALLSALDSVAETAIRVNPLKGIHTAGEAGFPDAAPVAWNPEGFHLPRRPNFTLNPLLHAGAFYVQEPSSMVYGALTTKGLEICGNSEAPRVLDMCAAPGGKTTTIISRLPQDAVVVANEYVASRCEILRENLAKWGFPNTVVCNSDTEAFAKAGAMFDIVAVDAPCSGEGMMRKDDDARSQWSQRLVESCMSLQREILKNATAALKPGGVLIYSTCTFNTFENERNLEYLAEHLGLECIDTGLTATGGILPGIGTGHPCLRFMPGTTRGEGLFAALLRKPDTSDTPSIHAAQCPHRPYSGKTSGKGKKGGKGIPDKIPDISHWLTPGKRWITKTCGDYLEAMTPETEALVASLMPHVNIKGAGIYGAERKGADWIPTTQLALSTAFNREAFPIVELPEGEALAYLHREAITLPGDIPPGFVAVAFGGLPLGMVKNLGPRANNLYPAKWKIRMDIGKR